jgi:4-hydroxybenzoate polyprenyl transferase
MGSMVLAFSYPYMKRITYWPQLFLGITFSWGAMMAWAAINNSISLEIIILYISAIFWTLGYDTIYGAQDVSDDEIIGLKSTSIKFKKNMKLFVSISYLITSLIILYLFRNYFGLNIFSILLIFFILSLAYQLFRFNKYKPKTCLEAFKFNNYSGLLLFLSIVSINF